MLLISASSSQNKLGLLPSSTFFSFDERESQQVKAIYMFGIYAKAIYET